jgi:hypothetical protein
MLRQTLAVAALAGALATAQAGSLMETVEQAAEVPLVALDLPATQGGMLRFAVCDGCEARSVVMPSDMTYLVNNRAVTWVEFAATVEVALASDDVAERSLVGLYFDAASKRLERIALVAPLPQQ